MSSPVSGITTVNYVPASSDEAVSLTSFVSDADSALRSQLARSRLDSALSFITRQYDRLKSLTLRLIDRMSQTIVPVTVDSLTQVQKSDLALRKLFADDGPNLGTSLSESNALYDELIGSGGELKAPISTPVLVERFDGNGKVLAQSFAWASEEQVAMLSILPVGGASSYPGSNLRETVIRNNQGKVTETTRFTIFSDYANRRPELSALSSAIGSIQAIVDKTSEMLKAELMLAAKTVGDVEKLNLQALQFQAESSQSINQARNSRIEFREDVLRRERIIKRDRDLRGILFDSTTGISTTSPAALQGAENPSAVPSANESGMSSEAERNWRFTRDQAPKR